jgi:hypothetical protein
MLEAVGGGMGEVEEQDGEDGSAGRTWDVAMFVRLVGGSGLGSVGPSGSAGAANKHGGGCLEASKDNAEYEKDVDGNANDRTRSGMKVGWALGSVGSAKVWGGGHASPACPTARPPHPSLPTSTIASDHRAYPNRAALRMSRNKRHLLYFPKYPAPLFPLRPVFTAPLAWEGAPITTKSSDRRIPTILLSLF